jgi:hypothetical protein
MSVRHQRNIILFISCVRIPRGRINYFRRSSTGKRLENTVIKHWPKSLNKTVFTARCDMIFYTRNSYQFGALKGFKIGIQESSQFCIVFILINIYLWGEMFLMSILLRLPIRYFAYSIISSISSWCLCIKGRTAISDSWTFTQCKTCLSLETAACGSRIQVLLPTRLNDRKKVTDRAGKPGIVTRVSGRRKFPNLLGRSDRNSERLSA